MNKLRELADEKGFLIYGWDLPKNTKNYDYLYMCLLQKWLRDNHEIHIKVELDVYALYYLTSILIDTYRSWKKIDTMFRTYEEALQEALILALNEIE